MATELMERLVMPRLDKISADFGLWATGGWLSNCGTRRL